LALNITTSYLQVLSDLETVESARLQLESTREQYARTEKLVKAGSLAQADLIQLESQIATEERTLVNSENQLSIDLLFLQQNMNIEPSSSFMIEKPELPDPEGPLAVSLSDVIDFAENNQPSVRAADLRKQSAELGKEIAEANRLPTVDLTTTIGSGYSSLRTEGNGVFTLGPGLPVVINDQPAELVIPSEGRVRTSFGNQLSSNLGGSLRLGLNVPIYNRRQVKSGIERAQINIENADYSAQIARQNLRQTIQQAYVDAQNAWSSYESITKQIDALQITFDNTEKQFNLGLVNSVDFLLAKNNLNRARFDLVRTKYTYIFRQKVLDFYQGKPIGF
ncbi:MAG: TolC family protein, partial [Bacteroidota bacterium]